MSKHTYSIALGALIVIASTGYYIHTRYSTRQANAQIRSKPQLQDIQHGLNNYDINYRQVQSLLQQGNTGKAIELLPVQNALDYYNRGTLLSTYAYQHSLSDGLRDQQTARSLSKQAVQDLQVATTYSDTNSRLAQQSEHNHQQAELLDTAIRLQVCYTELNYITNIGNDILSTTQKIHENIQESIHELQNKRNIPNDCRQKREQIFQNTTQEINNMQNTISDSINHYNALIQEYTDYPTGCLSSNRQDITQNIDMLQKNLQKYEEGIEQIQNTSNEDLCNAANNDSQINQDLDKQINKNLQSLKQDQNAIKPINTDDAYEHSNETIYKDIQHAQQLMQSIEQRNYEHIRKIFESQENKHSIGQYIHQLFQQFFGNTNSF